MTPAAGAAGAGAGWAAPGSTYPQPTPTYPQPGVTYPNPNVPGAAAPPGAVSPFVPPGGSAPGATFGGNIQPPSPAWDPYATPGSTPSALLPQDPYFQYGAPTLPKTTITKFIQEIRLDYHWFIGHGEGELGINDVQLDVTMALPFFFNSDTPLLITPGFATHWWEGPVTIPQVLPEDRPGADLPPRTYDAYINVAWNPQVTQWLGGELLFQTGLFTDFVEEIDSDDLRYRGSGVAVLRFSPRFQVKAGVMYLDRLRVKILPIGGIVWTPNPDLELGILFPNPRIRRRLMNYGSVEWWLYAMGDYGGGNWSITRADIPEVDAAIRGQRDQFDYNDIRMAVGLEFYTPRNFDGSFEAGVAFERELRYKSGLPSVYYPKPTVYLRGGLAY